MIGFLACHLGSTLNHAIFMLSRTQRAAKTLHDLRVGEVAELDVVIENGKVSAYRAKFHVSFKYEDHHA